MTVYDGFCYPYYYTQNERRGDVQLQGHMVPIPLGLAYSSNPRRRDRSKDYLLLYMGSTESGAVGGRCWSRIIVLDPHLLRPLSLVDLFPSTSVPQPSPPSLFPGPASGVRWDRTGAWERHCFHIWI